MSFPGQAHHPHTPGNPPLAHQLHLAAAPSPSPSGGEHPPYVPPGLELVHASWFVRHGERAPVRQRLVGVGSIPPYFPLCSIGRDFRAAVLSFSPPASSSDPPVSTAKDGAPPPPQALLPGVREVRAQRTEMDVRRVTEDPGEGAKGVRGGMRDCEWGELTDLGRLSTLTLGRTLRSLYITQLSFLPPVLTPSTAHLVSFRSTNMPRTIESLQQVVEGMWSGVNGERGEGAKVKFAVRHWSTEDLYPNTNCRRLRELDAASIKQAALNHNPELAKLDAVLEPIVGHPVRIDSSPRANGILDTLLVCRAHGIALPPSIEARAEEVLGGLERAVVREWFDAYSPTSNPSTHAEFRRLAMGRLLSSLRQSMQAKIEDPREEKVKERLAVYSCHDTSLGGILNTLDVFDGRWPPFTSHIAIELFRRPTPPSFLSSLVPSFFRPTSPHFVRLRYNSRTLRLPACAAAGNHLEGSEGEVCTWEAFKSALEGVEMGQGEWRRCCGGRTAA
ncbi:hypothetical protein JCM6882_005965 [Rhodosporidiobolus microsporus]